MMEPVVLVGAGGFGRETLDVIEAANRAARFPIFEIVGVLDDAPANLALQRLTARNIPFLGGTDAWLARPESAKYVITVGSPRARAALEVKFLAAGLEAASVIHPTAIIGSLSQISPGVIVCAGVQISTNVTLGRHVHVNPNATIGHDAALSDFVSINPGAIISGEVFVGERTLVGAGAVVLQGILVGSDCTIGASACVTRNVDEGQTVKGIPAR